MYNLYLVLRVLLYPVMRFILPVISSNARSRLNFELKELVEDSSVRAATYSFEVSSEGELEQVFPIINYLLTDGQLIEIIYCSPSVEHKCQNLQKEFSDQVRLLRLPIIRFNPFGYKTNPAKWLTGKYLILCRYDFFPELFLYAKKNKVHSILVSGMAETFQSKNFISRLYLKNCYKSFDKIVCTTSTDVKCFQDHVGISDKSLSLFDFRQVQIQQRQAAARETIEAKSKSLKLILDFFESSKHTLMLGSYWNHELELFDKLTTNNKTVVIAPHKLDQASIDELISSLNAKSIPVYTISQDSTDAQIQEMIESHQETSGVWLIDVKGILCELFTFFDTAYIGGGFGESVHSVLEPHLAGCKVYCGPNTQRSSEFRSILDISPQSICRLENLNDIALEMNKTDQQTQVIKDKIDGQNFTSILKWLDIEV